MVNGNYVLYGDRPVSDSEIVEDHVHTRTAERKVKRKPNRTANELQHSLNMAQIDNETDSIKYEKRVKEPRLLRYVPTTDVEENYISEKFETYDMKPTEERPRRYAFTKKPKNPADGSVNYAYSRSSSSCSSPNGNLPTISEHGEQYGTYRIRTTSPHVTEVIPGYENKLDKYFAKPREVKKFAAKGSHPDSLYRVPVEDERGSGKLMRVLRLLRWPAALLLVCVALAVFVYFLMPDNMDAGPDSANSTYWLPDPIAVEAVHSHPQPHTTRAPPLLSTRHRNKGNPSTQAPGTKISEIDFYDAVTVTNKNEISSTATSGPVISTKKLPIPPVFPSHITPEVQYGNERVDIDKLRSPKVLDEKNLLPDDSTLKPHITQKPEKPLEISFKDGISITSPSTETIFKAETNNDLINYGEKYTTIVNEGPVKSYAPIYKDHRPLYIPELPSNAGVNNNRPKQVVREPEIQEYYGQQQQQVNFDVNFTSGHSKLFGISIEDAGKMRSTTQSSVYNTRVSPTLPTWRSRDDATTKKYPVNGIAEVPQCRSTHLALCRGVLPYDLASAPININGIDLAALMPQIEYLVTTNCSERVADFACALLEPECSPTPHPGQLPCNSLCKSIVDNCEGLIPQELRAIFDCNLYSKGDCIPAKGPCLLREFSCADGNCMPRDWICDGKRDCPGGEDEQQCTLCEISQYRCRSGGCILKRWLCDGYSDCPGGEDESEEICETRGRRKPYEVDEPGEQEAGSAPAPAVRRPNRMPASEDLHRTGENDSSKELLITSDSSNAFKRNFTRRPSPSRLTPYSRPMLKAKAAEKTFEVENIPIERPGTKNFKPNNKTEPKKTKAEDSNEDVDIGDLFFEEFAADKNDKQSPQGTIKPKAFKPKNAGRAPTPQEDEMMATQVDKSMNRLNRVINGAAMMEKMSQDDEGEAPPDSLEVNGTVTDAPVGSTAAPEEPESPGLISAHASPCPNGELRCVDGRCITLAQLCDGTIDCTDHADEDNCYS